MSEFNKGAFGEMAARIVFGIAVVAAAILILSLLW